MKNKEEQIEKLIKDIDFEGTIDTLGALKAPDMIPFGLDTLDKISSGGVARGRMTEIFGAQASTKSSLCLQLVKSAQNQGLKVCYIDAEFAMTKELASNMGVDVNDMLLARPVNGEETFELIESLADKKYGLVIVDSVSALVPEDEFDADFEQQSIGLQARLMSKGMRKIIGSIMRNNTALVFINQIRDDVGKMGYGDKTTTSGGRALKFYASLRLKCARTGWLKSGDEKTGMSIQILVDKNKLGAPQKSTEINFYFSNGYDIMDDRLNKLIDEQEIKVVGKTYKKGTEIIGNTREEAKDYIKTH